MKLTFYRICSKIYSIEVHKITPSIKYFVKQNRIISYGNVILFNTLPLLNISMLYNLALMPSIESLKLEILPKYHLFVFS